MSKEFVVTNLSKSRLLESIKADDGSIAPVQASDLAKTVKCLSRPDESYEWVGYTSEEAKAGFIEIVGSAVKPEVLELVWMSASDTDDVRGKWLGLRLELLKNEVPAKMQPSLWLKKGPWSDHLKKVKEASAVEQEKTRPTLVWVHKLAAYVGRAPDGTYTTDQPMKKESAKLWLVDKAGLNGGLAEKLIKEGKVPMVDTFSPDDQQNPFFERQGLKFVNSYRPPELPPAPGPWPRIQEVMWMLTGGSADPVESHRAMYYLFNIVAAKVQAPCVRRGVTVVFSGPQGCGKSAFGEWVRAMVGLKNSTSINGKDLKDNFTSRYIDKLFVNVSEVSQDNGGDRIQVADHLKSIITDALVTHSAPHANRVQIDNRLFIIMSSNHAVPVKIDGVEERRYTVYVTPKEQAEKGTPYYDMVAGLFDPKTKEMTASAYAELQAFFADLQAHQVDWDLASRPFENQARAALAAANKSSTDEFIDEFIIQGMGLIEALWEIHESKLQEDEKTVDWSAGGCVTTQALYQTYREFSDQRGVFKKNMSNFVAEWNKRLGSKFPLEEHSRAIRTSVLKNVSLPWRGAPTPKLKAVADLVTAAVSDPF